MSSYCDFSEVKPLDPVSILFFTYVQYIVPNPVCSVMSSFCSLMDYSHQAPLPIEFPRQEAWSRVPFPTPEDLRNPGIEAVSLESLALASRFFVTSTTSEAHSSNKHFLLHFFIVHVCRPGGKKHVGIFKAGDKANSSDNLHFLIKTVAPY